MGPIRIILVDDHQMVREGLRRMLEMDPDMEVIAEAEDGGQALAMALALSPDIVLSDIRIPTSDGIQLTRRLKELKPECKVMLLTAYDAYLPQALEAGAAAYLLKGIRQRELVQAIREVREGRFPIHASVDRRLLADATGLAPRPFSDRELAVLRMVAHGLTSREMADQLSVGQSTIKRILGELFEKLGVRNRAEAVAEALKRNLI